MQTLFEFQVGILMRHTSRLHFISWANIWCFNFQIPDISLDQKSVYNNQIQSAPVHITYQSCLLNCHIYNIPKLTNTSPVSEKYRVWNLSSCHIVINYYWPSCFYLRWPIMANIYDNHIQGWGWCSKIKLIHHHRFLPEAGRINFLPKSLVANTFNFDF